MKLQIEHFSKYTYSEKVPLNPHALFLIPQQRDYFSISNSRISVNPQPLGINQRLDAENNSYYQVWFEGEAEQLDIKTDFILDLGTYNPFGFVLPAKFQYPFDKISYPGSRGDALQVYQKADKNETLYQFARDIMSNSPDTIGFFVNLLDEIHNNWSHTIRYETGIWSADKVYSAKEGSCRDLSWMLMQLLRNFNLATRFVSGYAFNPELDTGHELHAWVEVFLPDAGWIGLDPSLGLLTDQNYIPLATSFDPFLTLPISGTYGGAATAELDTEVWITEK